MKFSHCLNKDCRVVKFEKKMCPGCGKKGVEKEPPGDQDRLQVSE